MLEYAYIPRNTVSYSVVEISTGHARNNENNIKTRTAEHQTGNTGSYYPFDVFDQVNYEIRVCLTNKLTNHNTEFMKKIAH